jgi:hypothetical protein
MSCGFCGDAANNITAISAKNCQTIARSDKTGNISPMHFSTHIATLHSTFSLMAALLLRGAR